MRAIPADPLIEAMKPVQGVVMQEINSVYGVRIVDMVPTDAAKWMPISAEHRVCMCSGCGSFAAADDVVGGIPVMIKYKYCYNCGRKMDVKGG